MIFSKITLSDITISPTNSLFSLVVQIPGCVMILLIVIFPYNAVVSTGSFRLGYPGNIAPPPATIRYFTILSTTILVAIYIEKWPTFLLPEQFLNLPHLHTYFCLQDLEKLRISLDILPQPTRPSYGSSTPRSSSTVNSVSLRN